MVARTSTVAIRLPFHHMTQTPSNASRGRAQTSLPRKGRREILAALNREAMEHAHGLLLRSPRVLDYLVSRGWPEPERMASRYRLGFAPGREDGEPGFVREILRRRSLPAGVADRAALEEALLLAGLARRSESGKVYDYFYGRLLFPVAATRRLEEISQAEIVAFGGRILPWAESAGAGGDGPPKYLNTPATPVFDKGKILYGLSWAESAIRKTRRAVIVEGYLDLIRVREAGFETAVAQCGTALTPDHVRLLARAARMQPSGYAAGGERLSVTLATDADAAGRRAAERGARLIMRAQCVARIARFQGGKDPDDLIRDAGVDGRALFERALADAATPAVDYLDGLCEPREGPPWRGSLRALVASLNNLSRRAAGGPEEQMREDASRVAGRLLAEGRFSFEPDHVLTLFRRAGEGEGEDWEVGR
jgi:DNA primase